jgi:hypothetical protein
LRGLLQSSYVIHGEDESLLVGEGGVDGDHLSRTDADCGLQFQHDVGLVGLHDVQDSRDVIQVERVRHVLNFVLQVRSSPVEESHHHGIFQLDAVLVVGYTVAEGSNQSNNLAGESSGVPRAVGSQII